jgi:hypothetical protein
MQTEKLRKKELRLLQMRLSILSTFSNLVGLRALAIMKMNRRCKRIEKESFITS